jgi:diadenosine tetraphosphate (Ap4A) HIT family hydrolase
MIDAVDCPFCLPLVEPHIVLADEHCYAMWTRETPEGSAMVLPHAHRPTVFALTQDESLATRQLLEQMKIIESRYAPDGFNVGWNVLPVGGQSIAHAHRRRIRSSCHRLIFASATLARESRWPPTVSALT